MNTVPSVAPSPAPPLGTLQLFATSGPHNAVGDVHAITADGPTRSLTSTTLDAAVHEAAGLETSGIGAILQANDGFALVHTKVAGGDAPISSLGEPTPRAEFEAAFANPSVAAFVDHDHVAYATGPSAGGVQEISFVPPR